MDIREEYWSAIKLMQEKYKNQKTKDIRGERLARIAKRTKESQEEPIKKEFYYVLSQITGGNCSSYDRLGGFDIEEMKAITNAIKATLPNLEAAAS